MRSTFALAVFSVALSGIASAGTTIDLSAEASLPASNDLIRATVFAEVQGADPAEVARRVNQDLAEALRLIKRDAGISVKSGNQHSYPVYGQQRKIESWRMRSELHLESRDVAGLSALLGRLQQNRLALAQVSQMPSPDNRRTVEEAATQAALKDFERRATLVATTLGTSYRIRQLSIQQPGFVAPMPMLRGRAMMAASEAAPAPIEAGESMVTVTVTGQIELAN